MDKQPNYQPSTSLMMTSENKGEHFSTTGRTVAPSQDLSRSIWMLKSTGFWGLSSEDKFCEYDFHSGETGGSSLFNTKFNATQQHQLQQTLNDPQFLKELNRVMVYTWVSSGLHFIIVVFLIALPWIIPGYRSKSSWTIYVNFGVLFLFILWVGILMFQYAKLRKKQLLKLNQQTQLFIMIWNGNTWLERMWLNFWKRKSTLDFQQLLFFWSSVTSPLRRVEYPQSDVQDVAVIFITSLNKELLFVELTLASFI